MNGNISFQCCEVRSRAWDRYDQMRHCVKLQRKDHHVVGADQGKFESSDIQLVQYSRRFVI